MPTRARRLTMTDTPSPRILAFDLVGTAEPQPVPRNSRVLYDAVSDSSTIARVWNRADVARCRLCPVGRCLADDVLCLIKVPGRVHPDEADLFDARGLSWPPP